MNMNHDYLNHPYSSQRRTTFAKNGMVATSQPLASQAGLQMLKQGGNAIDAAIATAASLTVLEPTSNGIGGDMFAMVWTEGKLHGLNASGPSPNDITVDAVKEMGYDSMPKFGPLPVTVPGAPKGWVELSEKMGKLPLDEVLEPAINYAYEGFPISPILGKLWSRSYERFKQLSGEAYNEWFRVFSPGEKPPQVGEIWKSPGHGDTLTNIKETKARDFYEGELAQKIEEFVKGAGGFLSKEDLQGYQPEWVDPVNIKYKGYDVWELPPNGQGIVCLMALQILEELDIRDKDNIDTVHKQIEALKLAFSDGLRNITDPDNMEITIEELLSSDYAKERSKLIQDRAITPEPGKPSPGGTVYLAAADSEGNMVSLIQSNFMGFGSGLVVPDTGISLQNRGHSFSLDPNHPNCLLPNKRTYHTIIPGFLSKGDTPIGPFGVMGGYMQPQGHLQVLMNNIDFNLNPQAALDAPRWRWVEGKQIEVERHFPPHIGDQLKEKGHNIDMALDSTPFGRGQIIWRDEHTGVLMGGTESRTDGQIACY